jgi:hypothetical protein
MLNLCSITIQHLLYNTTIMFKNPFQVAISFAVIALIVKLSIFSMGMQHGAMEKYIWYIYMFLLLSAVFFGIRSNKIMHEGMTSLGQDFKTGARTASTFAILVTIITYVYYSQIDPEFFEIKKAERLAVTIEEVNKAIADGTMTIPEIKKHAIDRIMTASKIFAPQLHSMGTMIGLLFIGLFQSIVFAFLMKKSIGFKK